MNERIQELAIQASKQVFPVNSLAFMEKFAELLLKDCVSNVEAWEKDSRNHISYMLKNHYKIDV
jgi:hypothetical protein